ncbi:MAG: hypothetical protein EXQ55_03215 [Acidobacteria bacterium]|nr:hypothetical protein [Acidobacteriota bacterium]
MMFDDPSAPVSPPAPAAPAETPMESSAVQRYHSCRWRQKPEEGDPRDYCAHRDVQPMAGTAGFDPEAWCPECLFYKIRRIPKKRTAEDYSY